MHKYVIVGDLHLKHREAFDGPNYNHTDTKLNILAQAAKIAREVEAKALILLGDTFDTIEVRGRLMGRFWEALSPAFSNNKIEIWIVLGNHDYNLTHSAFDCVHAISERLYIRVFDEPKVVSWSPTTATSSFAVIPYGDPVEIKKFLQSVRDWDKQKVDFVIGHFDLEGAVVGAHQAKIKARLSPSDLKGFKLAMLGHIHKSQEGDLSGGGKWMYMGSPTYIDFAEIDDRSKGFYILHMNKDDHRLEFVGPGGQIALQHIRIVESEEIPYVGRFDGQHIVKVTMEGSANWLLGQYCRETLQFFREQERNGQILKLIENMKPTSTKVGDRIQLENAEASLDESLTEITKDAGHLIRGQEYLEKARNDVLAE